MEASKETTVVQKTHTLCTHDRRRKKINAPLLQYMQTTGMSLSSDKISDKISKLTPPQPKNIKISTDFASMGNDQNLEIFMHFS